MFLAKIKFALLACGLIATSALVVAQQARMITPEVTAQAASPGVPANRPARSLALDDDAAVARELGQLDLDLLTEEVHQLREQVEVTLRDKLRAERTNSPDAKNAQSAFESARTSYLAKARELRITRRRPTKGTEPREPGSHVSAAAIGSIDMDAVWKEYEKAKVSNKEYNAALSARKNELTMILSEAQEEAQMLSKLVPGSVDYVKRENRVSGLKAQHEAGREQSEREFARTGPYDGHALQRDPGVGCRSRKSQGLGVRRQSLSGSASRLRTQRCFYRSESLGRLRRSSKRSHRGSHPRSESKIYNIAGVEMIGADAY